MWRLAEARLSLAQLSPTVISYIGLGGWIPPPQPICDSVEKKTRVISIMSKPIKVLAVVVFVKKKKLGPKTFQSQNNSFPKKVRTKSVGYKKISGPKKGWPKKLRFIKIKVQKNLSTNI